MSLFNKIASIGLNVNTHLTAVRDVMVLDSKVRELKDKKDVLIYKLRDAKAELEALFPANPSSFKVMFISHSPEHKAIEIVIEALEDRLTSIKEVIASKKARAERIKARKDNKLKTKLEVAAGERLRRDPWGSEEV